MVKINDPEPGELIINIAKGRISKEEGNQERRANHMERGGNGDWQLLNGPP